MDRLLPSDMPIINELTVITSKTEIFATTSTTSEPLYTQYQYFNVPYFAWIVLSTVIIVLFKRIIMEFVIRWRK